MINHQLLELRTKLDHIDSTVVDLLSDRVDIVKRVAEIKGHRELYIMPGREVTMMFPLLESARKKLDGELIWRIWREIISYFTLMEGPLSGAVETTMWDLARDYYGIRTPLQEVPDSLTAIEAVVQGKHKLAILPMPEESADEPWWLKIIDDQKRKIFAHVPRIPGSNAKGPMLGGVVVADLSPDRTGNDITYIGVKMFSENCQANVIEALGAENIVRFSPTRTTEEHGAVALVRLNTFLSQHDIGNKKMDPRIASLHWLGGYGTLPI